MDRSRDGKHFKAKRAKAMTASLTLEEYLNYFLCPGEKSQNEKAKSCLLVATVYQSEKSGSENMIYARKMIGGKSLDPFNCFTKDMTGSNREGGLVDQSSVTVELMSSRSPSNAGAEQLQGFLEYCKKHSIKVNINFSFVQPFSWDNKFNREGLHNLYEKGVKLKILSFQQVINCMMRDLSDSLESLDQLETCRGTLTLDAHTLRRAISNFQDVLVVDNDGYYNEHNRRLQEILGYQNGVAIQKASQREEMNGFSLNTYRDYFLLQNSDEIWAKFKVNLRKQGEGITQEESLFEKVYSMEGSENNGKSNQNKVHLMGSHLWKLVGDNVTLNELANHREIVIQIMVVISEYPDRMGFCASLRRLQHDLMERIQDAGLQRVRVESSIRYAMDESATVSPNSSIASPSSSLHEEGGTHTTAECMHLQDILLDMLEDVEDNFKLLGRVEYDGRAVVRLDKSALSSALGLVNKAIRIHVDGTEHSMNGNFDDRYAEAANLAL
ncbi:uncharacterized protein LOC100182559 isoform X1 [Ciona intestinalis]